MLAITLHEDSDTVSNWSYINTRKKKNNWKMITVGNKNWIYYSNLYFLLAWYILTNCHSHKSHFTTRFRKLDINEDTRVNSMSKPRNEVSLHEIKNLLYNDQPRKSCSFWQKEKILYSRARRGLTKSIKTVSQLLTGFRVATRDFHTRNMLLGRE